MLSRTAAIALVALLMLCYGYTRPVWGFNQASRIDVLHAIFEQGTLAIDAYHENTGDKIQIGDHHYSDKAPGIVLLAVPAFAVTKLILDHRDIDIDSHRGFKISDWTATLFSVGLLTVLSALACFALFRRVLKPMPALLSVLAIYLGSVVFTYATNLFSHSAVAALIVIALYCIDRSLGLLGPPLTRASREIGVAGVWLGLALASEFTAAVVVGSIILVVALKSFRSALNMVLVACVPLLLVPINNLLTTGMPLSLPYQHVTNFPGMQQGLLGISLLINVETILRLLFSQYRGIFFWTPFLLLCFSGWKVFWKSNRLLFLLCCIVPIVHIYLISTYPYWHGGWALGPRHLAAIVPLLGIAALWGYQSSPKVGAWLASLSVVLTGIATIIDPLAPEGRMFPLAERYIPGMFKSEIRYNVGTMIGLEGWESLVPFIIVFILLLTILLRNVRRANSHA